MTTTSVHARTLADAEQRAHAELSHRRNVEHLDEDAELLKADARRANSPG
jgi:hypothetical protein